MKDEIMYCNFITLVELGIDVITAYEISKENDDVITKEIDKQIQVNMLMRIITKTVFIGLKEGKTIRTIKYSMLKDAGFTVDKRVKYKEYSLINICKVILYKWNLDAKREEK